MLPSLANFAKPDRHSAAAILAIELDGFGGLLKTEHDAEIARRPAAERDGFLDMVADGCPLGVFRDRDAHRELPFAEDRLVGSGHRDKIPEIESAGAARRRAAFADNDDIKRETHRVAGAIAFGLDLAQQAVK